MSPRDRPEDEVRQLLERSRRAVPAGLAGRALERGRRVRRRRRVLRCLTGLLMLVALALWWLRAAAAG
ncbi:hypothetical protein [Streptomyces sp. NPDC002537]